MKGKTILSFYFLVIFTFISLRPKAQSIACTSNWQQVNSTFSVVPFSGYTAPYYRNDDGYTNAINLPFSFCFYGTSVDQIVICNNGIITWGTSASSVDAQYNATPFPNSLAPMIAPFWADVYTVGGPGIVWYKVTPTYIIVQWDSVGGYADASSLDNSFQVIITNGTDPIVPDGYNIEFSYGQMQWAVGTASGGTNGFGSTSSSSSDYPAVVGINKGNGTNSLQYGLFNNPNSNYAGTYPPAPYDGVYWLNNSQFLMNSCTGNSPPVLSGLSLCSPDTFYVCEGGTLQVPVNFYSPIYGVTASSALSAPLISGVSISYNNSTGQLDSLDVQVIGSAANLGYNTIHLYGYDNLSPFDTTFASFVVEVTPAQTLSISGITNPPCFGGNGSATVTASGGTAPFTYSWASRGGTTATGTALTAGTYTVTVTDAPGCSITASVTITQPAAITPTTTATPVTCGNTNGTATVAASGGTPAYTYLWNPSGNTSITATGLSAGTYTVVVIDSQGCTGISTVVITSSAGIAAVITASANVSCNGGSDGTATVTTSSIANPPYTYSWNPAGGTSATGTGLSAGTYTVTLTDNSGCSATASVTITQPANAITATTTTTQATCGASNGTATVGASGGTPAYTYSWSPGGQTTANATGLSAGNYTITITDNNGCIQTTTASITSTSSLTVSVTISVGALCNGGNNGRATVTASSGTSPYTYSWSPAGGTTATGTGLSAGTYTVTVTDANGCNTNTTVTITEPPLLTATTGAPTNVLCNGGSTGSATVTAGGGTPAYTYSWAAAGGSNATGTGLSAGTYTVTVTDNNGCTAIASVTITEPAAITATTSTTQATCGAGNGTATVIASGGMPAYTYSWNPSGNTNSTATGLSSGTYTITITDNNGCIQTSTAIITSTSSITATISASTNVSCNGGTNGSATVTVASGTSPYTYSWSPAGGITATGTGFSAGTYTVTVTDNNGCSVTTSVTITEPPLLTATMGIPTNVLCNGGSSGSATVTAGGGTSPYTYSWAAGGGSNATGTGLSAATYTVTVTDNNGCIVTSTVTITEAAAISITTTTTAAACGASNGTATVTASGGVPAYTYLWTPSGNTTITATGLSVGVYTVSVTDNNGCIQTATVIISSSSGLAATITASNNITCNGGINGSATITATGGSTPYTYLWNPSGNSTATATGLSAGTYTITVTDNNGCTAVNTVTITQPALLTATMGSPTNVLCNGGATGSATVTAAGGTSPYAYSWAPAGGTNATGSGLSAATYTVTVTDNNGCTVTSSVTITEPPLLTATMGIATNGLCSGGNSSSVTVTVTGGTAAYTYSWTPTGGTSATASGLSAGTYTVNITDNNGCIVSSTVTITVPTALSVTLSTTGTTCSGSSNGSITATAAGGTAPYTYSWTPAGGNGATASNLSAGTYTVTVTDANGCTTTASAIVSGSAALTVTASGPNSICSGGNATLTSGVSGGTGPYTYLWSSGGTTATTIVNPTTTTTYTLTVTDANGCSATATVTVTTNQALSVSINGSDSPFCAGDSTILNATASGGDGAYTYLWLPGNNTTYSIIASPSSTTIYTVEVTSGCGSGMVTATFTVTVNPLPVTSFEANPASGCAPLCVQFRDLSTVGGGTITQWEWGFGKYDSIGPKNPDYCYPDTGSFTVSLTTTSNSGCRSTLTKVNMVTVYPPPNASFTYSPQPVDILDPVVQFTSTSSGRYPLIYWYWTFGDGTNSISYLLNPEHTYSDTGTFCATLVVENQFGCIDSVTNCVVVNPDFTLYIPDAFSPNGDGLNDIFMPKGNYIKDYDMYIFNRWEAQIFHTNDINTGWNGKVNGSGAVCQEDTYFYLINVTDSKGKLHSYAGSVTLLN